MTAAVAAALPAQQQPRYTAADLACAVFEEQVRTTIRSRSGRAETSDRAGRDGLLVVRSADSAGVLLVEAWYDSLAVWRETAAGTEHADTDGFVGGRYRGRLQPDGRFEVFAHPFVPDDLATLADLRRAFDDFFPPLAPVPLALGGVWTGPGLEIRRLDGGRHGALAVERFRWTRAGAGDEPVTAGDSLVTVRQETRERGELSWSAAHGPVAWERRIRVDARVPERAGVLRAMTSTVEQDVRVTRQTGHPACPAT